MKIIEKIKNFWNSDFFQGIDPVEVEEEGEEGGVWVLEALVEYSPPMFDLPEAKHRWIPIGGGLFTGTLDEAKQDILGECETWQKSGFIGMRTSIEGMIGLPVQNVKGWRIRGLADGEE